MQLPHHYVLAIQHNFVHLLLCAYRRRVQDFIFLRLLDPGIQARYYYVATVLFLVVIPATLLFSPYFYPTSRDLRVWIDNTRLFTPPTTTQTITSSAAVKQLVLFTTLLSLLRIPEEKSDSRMLQTRTKVALAHWLELLAPNATLCD